MRLTSVRSGMILPLLALLALPAQARAQETQLFTWTGRVDREVDIMMRGRNVTIGATRGEDYRGRFSVADGLPQMDGVVRVVVTGGRGEVSVTQQPNAGNNYSTRIRMVDRSSGADRYQITAFFTPANAGRYNRGRDGMNGTNGTYGNNGMNRDDRDDRDDRDNNGNRGNWNNGRRMGQAPLVLHWRGTVDATAEVRWQGDRVRQRALDGNALRGVRSSVTGNLRNGMARGGQVTLTKTEGRGQVDVVQQPSAENNWTTIVRINDPQGGYGRYAFDVIWQ